MRAGAEKRARFGSSKDALDLFRVKVDGHDEAVETQDLGENEDQDHSYEEPRLLCCPSHTCVTHNADSVAGRQTTQAYCQTSAEMYEAPVKKIKVKLVKV